MRDRWQFLLTEAFIALRRNTLMTFAAITTSAVALFLLGGLAYVYVRVNAVAGDVSGRFEMRVWLRENITTAQVKVLAKELRGIEGVKEARWIPREHEWKRTRLEMPEATEGLENPLPHSFKLILINLSDAGRVASRVQALPLVERNGVRYLKDEQEMMDQLMRMMRWLGGGLGSLLLVTAGILIYNAIRLTILARRREIRIMELVGASHFTIRCPFVIEGMFQGAIGGSFAAVLIMAAQAALEQQMKNQMSAAASLPPFPLLVAIGFLAAIGAGFGALCSTLALRDPFKFRRGPTA